MLPYIAYMDPHLNMIDDSGPSWHVSQCSCAPQIEKRIVLLVYDMASSFQPISKIIIEEGRFSQTSLKWNIFNNSYSIYFRIILFVHDFVCIMYYSLYTYMYATFIVLNRSHAMTLILNLGFSPLPYEVNCYTTKNGGKWTFF